MSLQQPESSLFAELEDTSPVGVASDMFFDATKDYLSAIRAGLLVTNGNQDEAYRDVVRKAELMGSTVQMLAVQLHEDTPETAPARLASALFLNERMQFLVLGPYTPCTSSLYKFCDDEKVFLDRLTIRSGESCASGNPAREALSQAAKDVLLLNTRSWINMLDI